MEELKFLEKNLNLKIDHVIESDEGLITEKHIQKCLTFEDDRYIICCGSKLMTKEYLLPLLLRMQVNKDKIVLF